MNKKSCVLCRNFISIYKINRTLHGRLGIRILSSRAESIHISHSFASLTRERYFQHSKVKFVYPSGHVMFGFLVPFFGPIVSLIFCTIFCPIFRPNFCRSLAPFFVRFFFRFLVLIFVRFFVLFFVRTLDTAHRTSRSDIGHQTSDIIHRTVNIGHQT